MSYLKSVSKKTIVITGGGTGGHIYPGLAIAQEIQKKHPDYEIHFVGAEGGLEEKIWPQYPFQYHLIRIGRLHSSVGRWQQIKTLFMMPFTLLHALRIFLKIKPAIVLGVGGFASGPFLFMAWLAGAKTALWEANAYPGLTNRWLARLVNTSFIVFGEAAKHLRARHIVEAGMPVREEFFKPIAVEAHSKIRLLVFGGSQGARVINDTIVAMVKNHPEVLEHFEIKHQTGSRDHDRIVEIYGDLARRVNVVEYIHDMPTELKRADVLICRSGASTVAEVISCKKPAIFIPLPTAADNHQFKNALVVAEKQGGIVLEQKDLTAETLKNIAVKISQDRQGLEQMAQRLSQFDFSKASQTIVSSLFEGVV